MIKKVKKFKQLHALKISIIMLVLFLMMCTSDSWGQSSFSQRDRDMLIEIKTTLSQMEKRFEQIEKRFEQVDKRLSDLRDDMNKRFEQVDKRFEQMMSFMWILATIFGALAAATIGFALWDRRTMIRPFESKVAKLENQIKDIDIHENYNSLIKVLKEYAAKDKKFASIIKQFNIF